VFGISDKDDAIVGVAKSPLKSAVFGRNESAQTEKAKSPGGSGVFGLTQAENAVGVFGANNNLKTGRGVQGNGAEAGVGGFSEAGAGVIGQSNKGDGVQGFTESPGRNGIFGRNNAATPAPAGGPPAGNGVFGFSNVPNASGIFGANNNTGWGVFGNSAAGTGVRGHSAGGQEGIGVTGTSVSGSGVAGVSSLTSFPSVLGRTDAQDGVGIAGYCRGTGGAGVLGVADIGEDAVGVWGSSREGLAGFFTGNVVVSNDLTVSGTLTAAEKHFKIDHPLDPSNKYLVHAAVESPELVNAYSGNVITDGNGDATVNLPDYFEALNADFRYQLTVVGQFAQTMVANEIRDSRFTIKTDKPNVKVSWQVIGIRQDAYAKAHPLVVEQEKPKVTRGRFLFPELHGQPIEMKIEKALGAELLKHLDQKIE